MPIIKQISAPNGVALAFHKPKSAAVDFAAGTAVVSVQSWPTEQAYLDGAPPAWSQPVPVAVADLADVEAGLLLSDWLAGGTSAPDGAASLDAAKARAWARVKAERDRRIYAPIEVSGKTFDATKDSLMKIMLTVIDMQATGGPPRRWTTADNRRVPMSLASLAGLASAAAARADAIHNAAQDLREQIEAVQPGLNAITAVEAIAWP